MKKLPECPDAMVFMLLKATTDKFMNKNKKRK